MMEKEIEAGEYVRTKQGYFYKIKRIRKSNVSEEVYMVRAHGDNYNFYLRKDNIANHSKNIIDLLQEGDYANGYKVIAKSDDGYIIILTDDIEQGELLTEEEIETILTKEQYEKNCYTVEREE